MIIFDGEFPLWIGSISKSVSHPFAPISPVALGRRARMLRRLPVLVERVKEELISLTREQQALVPRQDRVRPLTHGRDGEVGQLLARDSGSPGHALLDLRVQTEVHPVLVSSLYFLLFRGSQFFTNRRSGKLPPP